jgi:hypothetical protein
MQESLSSIFRPAGRRVGSNHAPELRSAEMLRVKFGRTGKVPRGERGGTEAGEEVLCRAAVTGGNRGLGPGRDKTLWIRGG